MNFDEVIARFGQSCGIDGLRPDEDGCCDLTIDRLSVHVFALPGTARVVIWGEVCPLPRAGQATFLAALMRGACLGLKTEGASFMIDPTSDQVCLQAMLPQEGLTDEAFAARMETFVAALERWQAFADAFDGEAATVAEAEQAVRPASEEAMVEV